MVESCRFGPCASSYWCYCLMPSIDFTYPMSPTMGEEVLVVSWPFSCRLVITLVRIVGNARQHLVLLFESFFGRCLLFRWLLLSSNNTYTAAGNGIKGAGPERMPPQSLHLRILPAHNSRLGAADCVSPHGSSCLRNDYFWKTGKALKGCSVVWGWVSLFINTDW